jgi:hypothetical protein
MAEGEFVVVSGARASGGEFKRAQPFDSGVEAGGRFGMARARVVLLRDGIGEECGLHLPPIVWRD